MATLQIEIGKKNSKKVRPVHFLVRSGKSRKRIPTEIYVTDSELSSNKKIVKEPRKAALLEKMRRELQDKIFELSLELVGREVDAAFIVERITRKVEDVDFFKFADDWINNSNVKGKRNYVTFLNNLERFIGNRFLPFERITYSLLQSYELSLRKTPRAMTLYLGSMRHLFREAMRQYNTDFEQVIKNDPFLRYRVPKQQMKKGVRALTLEELLKIYNYKGKTLARASRARDTFILSFCLMGMNSVDMYEVTDCQGGVIRYKRAKTRDRRSDEAYIEVKVHPFIKPLMAKYKGSGRVFSFSKMYSSPADFNRALNIGLKTIGKDLGIKNLQFYQARHTFATLSRNLMRYAKSDVDEALNHVGTMDIADIYIAKDFSIINDNNFRLIEKVFNLDNSGTLQ